MEFIKSNWKLIAAIAGAVVGGMVLEKTLRPIGRTVDALKSKAEDPTTK